MKQIRAKHILSSISNRPGAAIKRLPVRAVYAGNLAARYRGAAIGLQKGIESDYAGIRDERDRLAVLNKEQTAEIESLQAALRAASERISQQAGLIARLRNELSERHDALEKAEQRIRDARKSLTNVEHKLDDPFPESSGGA